jgi:hypothetical protein
LFIGKQLWQAGLFRRQMIRIIALAVQAVESYDRQMTRLSHDR